MRTVSSIVGEGGGGGEEVVWEGQKNGKVTAGKIGSCKIKKKNVFNLYFFSHYWKEWLFYNRKDYEY